MPGEKVGSLESRIANQVSQSANRKSKIAVQVSQSANRKSQIKNRKSLFPGFSHLLAEGLIQGNVIFP
jgi:hypothetical protein